MVHAQMTRSQRVAAIREGKQVARLEQARGDYGNRIRAWESYGEYKASGFLGNVSIRYAGTGGGSPFAYDVPADQVDSVVWSWIRAGADSGRIRFNETPPDHVLLIQGEIQRSIRHYDLTYSTEKGVSMRAAMSWPRHADGLQALALMKANLSPASWDDLQALFDRRPDAVVEFSTYGQDLGDLPGRNAVVWEVREVY